MDAPTTPEPPPLPEAATRPAAKPRPWTRKRIAKVCGLAVAFFALMALTLHAAILFYLDAKTPDYVQVGADTIYMVERTLYNEDLNQEVVLLGMAHVGDAAFYEAINQRMQEDGLILWEGVTDEHALLGAVQGNPYGNFGSTFGLAMQQRFDFPAERMVWADLDASALSAESLEILQLVFGFIDSIGDRDRMRAKLELLAKLEAENPGMDKRLMKDLVETRNARLLEVIREHADAPRLYVPWGAWHLPGVEAELVDDGYRLRHETRRPITAMTHVYGNVIKAALFGATFENTPAK